MGTKAEYPEERKRRAEQEFTDAMIAAQAKRHGICIEELQEKIRNNPVWAARLEIADKIERRRKFQKIFQKVRRFLRNHPEFLAQNLRSSVADWLDAAGRLAAQRGTAPAEVSKYLDRPLSLLDKGLSIAYELSEAEDIIADKKSRDKVLTLYETLVSRLRRAEAEKNETQKRKIGDALETLRPQAKRRMRALEPDYISSLSQRLRILRLQQEAIRTQEQILRDLSERIRESIKELTEVAEDPELTDDVFAELSAIPTVIDYSQRAGETSSAVTLDSLRKAVKKEEDLLAQTMKRIEKCKMVITQLKEIENAVINTLFPEFEISSIEWEEPVRAERKLRGLLPGVPLRERSKRMVRGERIEKEEQK